MNTILAERVIARVPSGTVIEVARIEVHALQVIVLSSVETHDIDDTHSPTSFPSTYEAPRLRVIIENCAIYGSSEFHTPEPTTIILKACYIDGSTFSTEEVSVPPLKPDDAVGRVYSSLVKSVEILDWWLDRLPEHRSTDSDP